jgi:hypothetical protein
MESTYNKLTPHAQQFFDRLKNYLDLPIYFFGSIQRPDYFFGGSDIDVDIFTPNSKSTLIKLQHFLHLEESDFKKMMWKINSSGHVVSGHKVMYKEPKNNLIVEFSIYDDKYKTDIIKEHCLKMRLPSYITVILILLKMFYYGLHIIPDYYYIQIKRFLLNTMINKEDEEEFFVVIDVKNPK